MNLDALIPEDVLRLHPGGVECGCVIHCETCGLGFVGGLENSDAWEWYIGEEETIVFCPSCKGIPPSRAEK